MGIITGLKSIQKFNDEQEAKRDSGPKIEWFALADKKSTKVRFLQELDPDAVNYSEKNGLGFIVVEHSNPADYRRRAVCTIDEGQCYGCERYRAAFALPEEEKKKQTGWKGRPKLYINAVENPGTEDEKVVVLSTGTSAKMITPTLIEYAGDGSITNREFKITRSGTGTDTSYLARGLDVADFDKSVEDYEVFDLKRAIREVPYDEQEAFFGEGSAARASSDESDSPESRPSAGSFSRDW